MLHREWLLFKLRLFKCSKAKRMLKALLWALIGRIMLTSGIEGRDWHTSGHRKVQVSVSFI